MINALCALLKFSYQDCNGFFPFKSKVHCLRYAAFPGKFIFSLDIFLLNVLLLLNTRIDCNYGISLCMRTINDHRGF